MVYTVTMNPALDYFLSTEELRGGEIHRYQGVSYAPGGKGLNVSQMLTNLGIENVATGVVCGFSGREIQRELDRLGCKHDFVFLPKGHSRINFKVCTTAGEETDFNGAGPVYDAAAGKGVLKKLAGLKAGDVLVVSGSLPPALPSGFYGELLAQTKGTGALQVVDAAGEALKACLAQGPFLIKPNLEELAAFFGMPSISSGEAARYGTALQELGAKQVLVSMGGDGALLCGKNRFQEKAVPGRVVSTVGAGDAMVAGFLYGYLETGTLQAALQWGIAAGSATAFTKGIASREQVVQVYQAAFG